MTAPVRVVEVTGPPLAGVTSLVAALRERMPETAFVEADERTAGEPPAAVVVVLSAVAPMTESDCRRVDVATARAASMIGVLAKVDAHRGWRDVLAADRAALLVRSARYRTMPWVPVAAAPDVGPPELGPLVETLRNHLGANEITGRSALEARIDRLRAERAALIRDRGRARSERTLALRGGLARTRAMSTRFLRRRSLVLRTEFRARAADVPRGGAAELEAELRSEVAALLEELDVLVVAAVDELAETLDVATPIQPPSPPPAVAPELGGPAVASRSGERRLTTVLGAGFGLGVAMAVSRLLGGLTHESAGAALIVGALSGFALTAWLVMTRALLQDRALLDRWVTEVVATTRWHGEESIASRLLAAELAFVAASSAREEVESGVLAERLDALDAELRALMRRAASPNPASSPAPTPDCR